MSLLQIENLSLAINGRPILKNIDLAIEAGKVMGLVGESGSGKSLTALAVMRLLPRGATTTGRISFDGTDILSTSEDKMLALRGDEIGMVFQEPMTALNPVKTIGEQVAEGIRWHRGVSRAEAEDVACRILDRVGMPEAKFPLSRYPHELSGGQRQRVVIAIATALKPKLLIADEPTTALDVVLQAQILDLLRELVSENRMGLLLISHDLAVVADMADEITILRDGQVMDAGETGRLLSQQAHPYTRQLTLASTHVPAVRRRGTSPSPLWGGSGGKADRGGGHSDQSPAPPPRPAGDPPHKGEGKSVLLRVSNVTRDYPGRRRSLFGPVETVRAVDGVSFEMRPGQSIALVGRSGCGKSTLARMILALDQPTSGEIEFGDRRIDHLPGKELRASRRDMQVVFQDPYGSFDPRQKVEKLVAEPLHLLEQKPTREERRDRVVQALQEVGLSASDLDKYPHEFSGGQRQRLSIARALITRPKLIVADEPVSALDVSIRAQVLDLLADLNNRLKVAYLFITHDLTVARAITDDVLVMHEGKIVERGTTVDVLDNPRSEAAKALVAATPDLHTAIRRRLGEQG